MLATDVVERSGRVSTTLVTRRGDGVFIMKKTNLRPFGLENEINNKKEGETKS